MSLVSIYALGMALLYLALSPSSSFLVDPEHLYFLACFVGELHSQRMLVFSGIQC